MVHEDVRGEKKNKTRGTFHKLHLIGGFMLDVIVYIFAHLHTTLRTEENLLGIY